MAAYVIAEIEVTDPVAYEEYRRGAERSLEVHGGSFLVRGGEVQTLEGSWRPARIVVLRFESLEKARAWWSSAEYEAPRAIRLRSATTKMIAVEGVTP